MNEVKNYIEADYSELPNLPQLPEPDYWHTMGGEMVSESYTDDAMRRYARSYAELAVAAERERQGARILHLTYERDKARADIQALTSSPTVDDFAIKFIEQRAEDYFRENTSTDPDDGSTIWHYGDAGRDYHNTLEELADDIRLAFASRDKACAASAGSSPDLRATLQELAATQRKLIDANAEIAALRLAQSAPALTVWYGPMPESNGRQNYTALLMRKGGHFTDGITLDRSEYPERVRYEADRVRHLIGELDKPPCILDYDADKHSGYEAPFTDGERYQMLRNADFSKTGPTRGIPWVVYLDPKQQLPRVVVCQGQELDTVADAALAEQRKSDG